MTRYLTRIRNLTRTRNLTPTRSLTRTRNLTRARNLTRTRNVTRTRRIINTFATRPSRKLHTRVTRARSKIPHTRLARRSLACVNLRLSATVALGYQQEMGSFDSMYMYIHGRGKRSGHGRSNYFQGI